MKLRKPTVNLDQLMQAGHLAQGLTRQFEQNPGQQCDNYRSDVCEKRRVVTISSRETQPQEEKEEEDCEPKCNQ
jgi:hypothetical protein